MTRARRKLRILVVDDDALMRDLISDILIRQGFQVQTAPNGLKLVSNLKATKPDFVILDIAMSWISGFDLCRFICQSGLKHPPVMFVSGHGTPENIERCFACGAVDFLAKPFDVDELVRRVELHLGLLPPAANNPAPKE